MDALPNELLALILAYCIDVRCDHHVGLLRCVCKAWKCVVDDRKGMHGRRVSISYLVQHPALVAWARDIGYNIGTATCGLAARHGRLETLQWLHKQQGVALEPSVCNLAALGGHLNVLQWTTSVGCKGDCDVFMRAVQGGSMEVATYVKTQGGSVDDRAYRFIMKRPGLDWVKTLHKWRVPMTEKTCALAARHGRLDILKYLRSKGCAWSVKTFQHAVIGGHMHVMEWLWINRCPYSIIVPLMASRMGRLDLLQWLDERNYRVLITQVMTPAIRADHMPIIHWMRSNGVPFPYDACTAAAQSGRLNVLQWLRSEGCAWDFNVCNVAASMGHLHVLLWALEQGCDCDTPNVIGLAAQMNRINVLEYIHTHVTHGKISKRVLKTAAIWGCVDVLEWAHEHGCRCDDDVYSLSIRYGHLNVLKWAYSKRPLTEEIWRNVRMSRNADMREWAEMHAEAPRLP